MSDKVYRIMRKDGLFSNGGTEPDFNKQGKTWSTLGQLKNHLKLFYRYSWSDKKETWDIDHYKDCSIIEYKMVLDAYEPVQTFINDVWPKKK